MIVNNLQAKTCKITTSAEVAQVGSLSANGETEIDEMIAQAMENAGKDGAVIAGEVLRSDTYEYGYDAQTDEYKNLVEAGIIDPTKVVRTALQDAASVASLLITTEAMVAERPNNSSAPIGGPGGGMGGMGGMGGGMDF